MKKYIKIGIALLFIGAAFNSCEGALDINESEVNFTTDLVNPDLLLAGAIQAPRGQFEVTTSELGSILMNQWAGDINNVTGGFQDEFRLNITQNFYTSIWQNLYRGMGTYQAIIDSEGDAYNNHKAIARILKSYYFQYIIDLYGDAPYSQALQGGDTLTPAYDDAQTVYRALVEDINLALATFANSGDYLPVGTEDTVFQGDLNGWAQVANTLKLRILLRQSEMGGETATYLATEFATLDNNFVTTDAVLNPGYVLETNRMSPFWANYGFDIEDNATFDHDFIVPSEYFEKFLKGDNQTDANNTPGALPGTGKNDTRLDRFFDASTGVPGNGVTGVVQGATNTTAPTDLSEPGPGLLRSFDQDSYIFTASESFFLQAEAIERGYMSGNAQAMFEAGITASFNLLGNPGDAAAYILDSQTANRIGWTGSANKIEAIMTQKWIALSGFNAIESFIDYNRTGFPNVPLSVIAEKPSRPVRLLYPASEFSTNSGNVPSQQTSDAFSDKIFWDVN
ncbi:SusD/RagB family nutrient-binding outer membrane lipoprotein [Lacinutrix jangbogonensis]|uniref:SusD/RagB family nutrient-binding outer membrane lipoprotein n=1 Tax=Lacinutrix jangbogonensis TaxID=1469557 RepID=UPI00068FABA1|nr:SusD/RagB family nutrient-binding outer membrane lipoprotein [Lacinutrix jangbogonensis]